MAAVSATIFIAGVFCLSIIKLDTPVVMGIFSVVAVMVVLIKKCNQVDHAIGGLIAMLVFFTLAALADALGASEVHVKLFAVSTTCQFIAYTAFIFLRAAESKPQ